MAGISDEVAYAREVYAACLTVGFSDEHVRSLKRLLDEDGTEAAGSTPRSLPQDRVSEMVSLARAAQAASVEWAFRRAMR